MFEQSVFDNSVSEWKKKKFAPWARMRYEITNHFIRGNLNKTPKKILNVGCGDGIESYLLDSFNAEHVLSDLSEEMISSAREFLEENSFKSTYRTIHSDVVNLAKSLDEKFDLILFHNVIEYLSEPNEAIAVLVQLLDANGIFSIRHLNRYANLQTAASYHSDLDLVEEYLQTGLFHSSFGVSIQTYSGEEIENMLCRNNLEVVNRYGLMPINSFITDNEKKQEPIFYEKLKKIEIGCAQQFPHYHYSRFGLFIARKGSV